MIGAKDLQNRSASAMLKNAANPVAFATGGAMISLGSYVTHAKLPELGAGEVVTLADGVVRIRFAGGERAFLTDMVAPHLTVTMEAPVRAQAPAAARRARKPKAKAAR
jgi:hypothetical protein